jgi:hypothetical protein
LSSLQKHKSAASKTSTVKSFDGGVILGENFLRLMCVLVDADPKTIKLVLESGNSLYFKGFWITVLLELRTTSHEYCLLTTPVWCQHHSLIWDFAERR